MNSVPYVTTEEAACCRELEGRLLGRLGIVFASARIDPLMAELLVTVGYDDRILCADAARVIVLGELPNGKEAKLQIVAGRVHDTPPGSLPEVRPGHDAAL